MKPVLEESEVYTCHAYIMYHISLLGNTFSPKSADKHNFKSL